MSARISEVLRTNGELEIIIGEDAVTNRARNKALREGYSLREAGGWEYWHRWEEIYPYVWDAAGNKVKGRLVEYWLHRESGARRQHVVRTGWKSPV